MKVDNVKSQMRKGMLEYCIMLLLHKEPAYASDIIQKLKEAQLIVVEGTLYPLLTRLKNDDLLSYEWVESTQGPPRKYYKLTEQLDYMMDWMYAPSNVRKQMEEEGHVYSIAYKENEPCGYVSVQQQEKDVFHLQKIYVLPRFQGTHCGSFLFKEAIKCIKEIHPEPCLMELNVNRNNKALQFYEYMGMRKLREGDFPIGNGYYMNDYIMGLDI